MMQAQEKQAVVDYIRSYLGCARCGLVDSMWTEEQQQFGYSVCEVLLQQLGNASDWLIPNDVDHG